MQVRELRDIPADAHIVPGVCYGRPDQLLSPAYWEQRCVQGEADGHDFISRGGTLHEEVGFCLLGGFGVTLEVGEAFYARLLNEGVFEPDSMATESDIYEFLNTPALVLNRPHRYRFPKQRARRIHKAMKQLDCLELDCADARIFRDKIEQLEGIGPKTASWIARNWLGAETVAILDIHVIRAGWAMNLFERDCRLPNDYIRLEDRFLDLANPVHSR